MKSATSAACGESPCGSGMERSSRHHNATASALEWKHRAARGTCGITDENTGNCLYSSKGSFGLPKHALDSWTDAAPYCLDRCKQCARCQHVSISLTWKDCSWFARCDNLDATGPGVEFLSGAYAVVCGRRSRAASGLLCACYQ